MTEDQSLAAEGSVPSEVVDDVQQPREGKSRLPWRLLIVLLIIVLAGVGGFNYWVKTQYEPALAELAGRFDSVGTKIAGVSSQITTVAGDAAAVAVGSEGAKAGLAALERRQRDLADGLEKLRNQQVRGSNTWQLREVEYLLVAGNQRLLLASDVNGASAALHAADERLRDIGDPALFQVRAAITEERNALAAVRHADIDGQALYLADILNRVGSLPLKDTGVALLEEITQAPAEKPSGWRGVLRSMWADVLQVVEVKQMDAGDALLFDPDARQLLYQNLRLELASSRLAVLNRDTANMRASLAMVQAMLQAYFSEEDEGVANIITTLESMQKVELAPSLPSIDGSLKRLKAVIAAETAEAG
jgi:uroporphyrin-3 C-methyltransferase